MAAGDSTPHQPGLGFRLRFGRADDADDFVDIGIRQQQAFDGVFTLPLPCSTRTVCGDG